MRPGSEADSFIGDDLADTTTSMKLRTGDFAIFSAGPDRTFNAGIRADEQEFNKDNIVEVGP